MLDELHKKSLTDLRVMAQAFGVKDIFEKDARLLAQEIYTKHQNLAPPPQPLPPKPPYDARLMTAEPGARVDMQEIIELLSPYIAMGLKLDFDEESWFMTCGLKNDSGTIRMPLRNILQCAEKVVA